MSIIERFDGCFTTTASSKWEPPPRPTSESLSEINHSLAIPGLPPLLIKLACEAQFFSSWFAGLGPDFTSPRHIIQLNEHWRKNGLPKNFVLMTYAFDAVCDCFDIESAEDPGLFRIIQTQLEDGLFEGYEVFAPNFESYVERLVVLFRERNRQR